MQTKALLKMFCSCSWWIMSCKTSSSVVNDEEVPAMWEMRSDDRKIWRLYSYDLYLWKLLLLFLWGAFGWRVALLFDSFSPKLPSENTMGDIASLILVWKRGLYIIKSIVAVFSSCQYCETSEISLDIVLFALSSSFFNFGFFGVGTWGIFHFDSSITGSIVICAFYGFISIKRSLTMAKLIPKVVIWMLYRFNYCNSAVPCLLCHQFNPNGLRNNKLVGWTYHETNFRIGSWGQIGFLVSLPYGCW